MVEQYTISVGIWIFQELFMKDHKYWLYIGYLTKLKTETWSK